MGNELRSVRAYCKINKNNKCCRFQADQKASPRQGPTNNTEVFKTRVR